MVRMPQQTKARCSEATKLMSLLLASAPFLLAGLAASQGAYAQASAPRTGKEIVDSVCAACHRTGEQGAPKIGDENAWAKRASQGLSSLTKHALEGIRKMPAHGGSPGLKDVDIQRAITYMVNQSGGHWIEPVGEKEMAKERTGEQVVNAQCVKCHAAGVGGAPKIGDHAAWAPRMQKGVDALVRSAIHGHGGMPARGGEADLTDTELRNAVLYMFNPPSPGQQAAPTAAAAPAPSGGMEQLVGGLRIVVGFEPAEAIKALPPREQAMHGGAPAGSGYYHLNVSLFDRVSNTPILRARVDARVERPGLGGESRRLEAMAAGAGSYGGYFRVVKQTTYQVVLRIRTTDSPSPVEWRFSHTF